MEPMRWGNGRGITTPRGRNAKEINHKCTEMYIFLIILPTIVCLNGIRYYKNNF